MRFGILQFLFFVLLLSLVSFWISDQHTKDKAFLFADSTDVTKVNINKTDSSSMFIRYLCFWNKILFLQGGKTSTGEPVYSHLTDKILPTIHLALFSLLFGGFFAYVFSLSAFYLRSPILVQTIDFVSKFILSTPIFIVSILLLLIFFYKLELFPPGGYESGNSLYVVLPALALGSRVFARLTLYLLPQIEIETNSPYVKILETRSYPWAHIIWKEIFLKVLPLSFVILLLDFGSLLSGAMVVEEIFFFPGVGNTLYKSIRQMDTDLLAILLMYSGILFYLINKGSIFLQKKFSGEGRL